MTLAEHLAALHARLDAVERALGALAGPLSAAQRRWRPGGERWGVGDCCAHLLTVNGLYLPRLAAALAAAPPDPTGGAGPWRPTWFGRRFVQAAGPAGRPIRAFAIFRPPPTPPDDAPERLVAQQGDLRALLHQAAGRDLRAPRVRSPLTRFLTLRAGEALEMLVAHEERHLRQAERVRAERSFPAA